jgi:hypothetical protein
MTCATRTSPALARAGVPVKAAQERVGHSRSNTTLDITHTLRQVHREAAGKVESLMLATDNPQA